MFSIAWKCSNTITILELCLQIGQYIASNGGVVTAEELAPYLDLETGKGNMVGLLLKKF